MTSAPRERGRDYPRTEMMILQRWQDRRKALKKDEICQFGDKPEENLGHQSRHHADGNGERHQHKHSRIGAKIPQERGGLSRFLRFVCRPRFTH